MASVLSVKAQDESVFMHYTNSPTLINPAHAGFQEQFQALFNFRNQWTTFPGSAFTYSAGLESPIGKVMGAGFRLWSENIASITSYKVQLDYAFRYEINKLDLAGGFSTAYKTVRLNPSEIDNTWFDEGDPIAMGYLDGEPIFDATFGLFGKYNDKTSVGVTFPSLIVRRLNAIEQGYNDEGTQKYLINLGEANLYKAIDFYKSTGATYLNNWSVVQMNKENLEKFIQDN